MSERTFVFQDELIMSEGEISSNEDIPAFLLAHIPLAVKVERANRNDDRKGIDYWVTLQSGRMVSVDVKVRKQDFAKRGEDDLALEIWSVVEAKVIGWTRDANKQTDYILWIWKDTKRCVIVPFPWLCSIFIQHWEVWHKKYKTAFQLTDYSSSYRYHSECVYVPRALVFKKLYAALGGLP